MTRNSRDNYSEDDEYNDRRRRPLDGENRQQRTPQQQRSQKREQQRNRDQQRDYKNDRLSDDRGEVMTSDGEDDRRYDRRDNQRRYSNENQRRDLREDHRDDQNDGQKKGLKDSQRKNPRDSQRKDPKDSRKKDQKDGQKTDLRDSQRKDGKDGGRREPKENQKGGRKDDQMNNAKAGQRRVRKEDQRQDQKDGNKRNQKRNDQKDRRRDEESENRREGRDNESGGKRYGRRSGSSWADDEDDEGAKKYDLSWWNYVPPEPTEEEIFWTIPPGENFRGYSNLPAVLKGPRGEKLESKFANSFEEAQLSHVILRNVEKSQYKQPTPIQKNAFPIINRGDDLMACAQTGSGKTAAYLLPILSELSRIQLPMYVEVPAPLVLVLVPTTELARQVHIDARRFAYKTNIRIATLYGGCDVRHQIQQLQNGCGCHLVVATPGRLLRLLEEKEISLSEVKQLVLDEADRMMVVDKKVGEKEGATGSGFYYDVRKILNDFDMPAKEDRQTLMFSATFPTEVQEMAQEFLNEHIHMWIGEKEEGCSFSDIKQSIVRVEGKSKRDKLLEVLQEQHEEGKRVMVFVITKNMAKRLVRFLKQNDFSVSEIHSDRVQGEREVSLRKFRGMKGEVSTVPIIVATSAASRGLDIQGVELVINYDLPDTSHVRGREEYIHKVGRTGRIGNTGKAISFFDPQKDVEFARSLVQVLSDAQQEIPDWLEEEAMHAIGTRIDEDEEKRSRDIRN